MKNDKKKSIFELMDNLKKCKNYIYYTWLIMFSLMFNDDDKKTVYKIVKNQKEQITKEDLILRLSTQLFGFKTAKKRLEVQINNYYKASVNNIVKQYYKNCSNQKDLEYYLKYSDIDDYEWHKVPLEMVRAFKNNLNNLNNINKGFITDIFGVKVFWCSFGSPAGYKEGKPRYNDVGMFVFSTEPINPKKWNLWLSNRFKQSLEYQHDLFLGSTALYGGKIEENVTNKELLEQLRPNKISDYERKILRGFENWKEDQLEALNDLKELDNLDDGTRTISYLNSLYDELIANEYNKLGNINYSIVRRLDWIENQQNLLESELSEYNGF